LKAIRDKIALGGDGVTEQREKRAVGRVDEIGTALSLKY
jgi:hypothetical protein